MNTTTTLNDIQYGASICLKCGSCTYGDWPENHHLCSLYYRDECFTHGGGGFMSIVTALAEKLMPYDERAADLAFTCAGCLACDSRCSIIKNHPPQVDMMDMIRLLRYEAVKQSLVPKTVVKFIQSTIKADKKDTKSGLKLPAGIKSDKAETVIFTECSHSGSQKDISASLASLLGKIGTPVATFSEAECCGSSFYDYGYWDELKPVMEANWDKIKGLGSKTFVFFNPHCEEFIARRYPEIIEDCKGISNKHISQVLAAAFKDGKLKSKTKNTITVSYHDPCYLGRGLGIYDAPREVLAALDGVKLVEMTRNRKSAYCCGARSLGGYFPDHSRKMAKERIAEFEATGADILITACPYCRENFRKVAAVGKENQIKDLVEFVEERV
jgi:heterodisulfide reductase subunit D